MGYFQVRYDSRVVNYDRKGFISLATVLTPTIKPKMVRSLHRSKSNVTKITPPPRPAHGIVERHLVMAYPTKRKKSNVDSVTSKKSPNVYKSCPKRILLVKWNILTPLQKLPKMFWQFGKNDCCLRLWKVAQSVINCLIWSHWMWTIDKHRALEAIRGRKENQIDKFRQWNRKSVETSSRWYKHI